jgi:hypothetical protein
MEGTLPPDRYWIAAPLVNNSQTPHTVDFGTGADSQTRHAKNCAFSNAGGGWNQGFWHTCNGRLKTFRKPTSGPNDLRFFRYPPGIGVKTGLARYGQIEWSRAVVGGGSIRAFLGRHMGPNPTDRANLGSKRHLICDGRGIPLALQLTGANRNDSQQAQSLTPFHCYREDADDRVIVLTAS